MQLQKCDWYSVDAGSSEEFTVTFTGVTKQPSSNSYEFEIFATVTEWNSIPFNEPLPTENDSITGSLEIATYGSVELRIIDVSTRQVDAGEEFSINLQLVNKGNDNDRVRVDLANLDELKQAGFGFIGSEFLSEELAMGRPHLYKNSSYSRQMTSILQPILTYNFKQVVLMMRTPH